MNRNFKIGDEVLVRMEIRNILPSGYAAYLPSDTGNVALLIASEHIFAHAPEFNIGEELEFSAHTADWFNDTPTGYSWDDGEWEANDGCWYSHARRPQPKPEESEEKTLTLDGKKYKLVLVEE